MGALVREENDCPTPAFWKNCGYVRLSGNSAMEWGQTWWDSEIRMDPAGAFVDDMLPRVVPSTSWHNLWGRRPPRCGGDDATVDRVRSEILGLASFCEIVALQVRGCTLSGGNQTRNFFSA